MGATPRNFTDIEYALYCAQEKIYKILDGDFAKELDKGFLAADKQETERIKNHTNGLDTVLKYTGIITAPASIGRKLYREHEVEKEREQAAKDGTLLTYDKAFESACAKLEKNKELSEAVANLDTVFLQSVGEEKYKKFVEEHGGTPGFVFLISQANSKAIEVGANHILPKEKKEYITSRLLDWTPSWLNVFSSGISPNTESMGEMYNQIKDKSKEIGNKRYDISTTEDFALNAGAFVISEIPYLPLAFLSGGGSTAARLTVKFASKPAVKIAASSLALGAAVGDYQTISTLTSETGSREETEQNIYKELGLGKVNLPDSVSFKEHYNFLKAHIDETAKGLSAEELYNFTREIAKIEAKDQSKIQWETNPPEWIAKFSELEARQNATRWLANAYAIKNKGTKELVNTDGTKLTMDECINRALLCSKQALIASGLSVPAEKTFELQDALNTPIEVDPAKAITERAAETGKKIDEITKDLSESNFSGYILHAATSIAQGEGIEVNLTGDIPKDVLARNESGAKTNAKLYLSWALSLKDNEIVKISDVAYDKKACLQKALDYGRHYENIITKKAAPAQEVEEEKKNTAEETTAQNTGDTQGQTWADLVSNSAIGEFMSNLGYDKESLTDLFHNPGTALSNLPDAFFGGKKSALLPIALFTMALGSKNILVKCAGFALAAYFLKNNYDISTATKDVAQTFTPYRDEELNPNISNVTTEGKLVMFDCEGTTFSYVMKDETLAAVESGTLPINVLVNTVYEHSAEKSLLARADFDRQMAEQNNPTPPRISLS